MIFDSKEAAIIERLRDAAKEHGEVFYLLAVLSDAIEIDDLGNRTLECASEDDIRYIRIAQSSLAFCKLDRGE